MFIHREIGLKKTTDQNKFSIQCSSYCWQTRKESKYSFILPVLHMRSPQNWAVAATNLAKHWDAAPPAAGSVQGGAAEQLQAPGLGRWAIPCSRPTALHYGHQPLNVLPLPLLLASWVAFYNLAFAVCLLSPSLLWFPEWLQSALTASTALMALSPHGPMGWSSQLQRGRKPEDLRISSETVGMSNKTIQFISNLLHSVFTRFHHSVTSSSEVRFSTGWKRIDTTLKPAMLWIIEYSQQQLPDFLIHFILQDSFLKSFNATLFQKPAATISVQKRNISWCGRVRSIAFF